MLHLRAAALPGQLAALVGNGREARIGLIAGHPDAELRRNSPRWTTGAGTDQEEAGGGRQTKRLGEAQNLGGATGKQETLAP